MKTMVIRKVYLRPTRSPMRPKTIAPKGRTRKPAASVAALINISSPNQPELSGLRSAPPRRGGRCQPSYDIPNPTASRQPAQLAAFQSPVARRIRAGHALDAWRLSFCLTREDILGLKYRAETGVDRFSPCVDHEYRKHRRGPVGAVLRHLDEAARSRSPDHGGRTQRARRHVRLGRGLLGRDARQHRRGRSADL